MLKAASFRARPSTITALMGRNGSGKSTMLKIAVGLVRPDHGRVLWQGRFLPRPRLHEMARAGLFYSDQDAALTPHFTVRDHLAAFARVFDRSDDIDAVIERLNLTEFLDRRPKRLSGGERQRSSLALAALRSPRCLLMDEPFAGVAPIDRPLIARGLQDLRDRGCAVVVSGHDIEDVFAIADEVVWVTSGTTHDLGSPRQAGEHPQFRREYLGSRVPPTSHGEAGA
ncbi:MAG: ABC transporter ATP-binding protein [Gemmatimonadetes bacterium]|nr:ABC transporter ATP-binding protein [Gemmatimonadota bacterium]